MADGRHIEHRFLAISRRHIGWLKWHLEQRWRITCRYRSRDQNSNFRKFKMADGRHIENRILVDVCESWIADVESHANRSHVTKTAIFDNSAWQQQLRW